jgi:hypothetical protein
MDDQRRTEFVGAYTQILVTAWSSELFARRLQRDPVPALAEHGLTVPPGSEVVVLEGLSADAEDPSLDAAISTWEAGDSSGRYVLFVPSTPQMHAQGLSDDDLATVVAGYQINQCCCTPCCCCT